MAVEGLYFDVFPGDDPNGTSLGELTKAFDKACRVEWNGIGSGQFSINRNDSQVAWCATDNLVRVRLVAGGPFDYDDDRYVFAFWIAEGTDTILSEDEEGGEDWARGGPGVLAYLSRAILAHEAITYPIGPQPDGTWLWTDEQLGSIWRRVIDEAQAHTPNPLPDMTYDFTDTVDTLGEDWIDIGGPFKLAMGDDLLTIAGQLRAQGLAIGMTPALVGQAWQDYVPPVRTITFAEGDNITEAAQRKVHATPAKSRVLVKGSDEDEALKFRWVADAGIETAIGVREGFIEYEHTPTDAMLDNAGREYLDTLAKHHDGPSTIGVLVRNDEEPFTDYFPGDVVTVDIPGEYDEVASVIHAIVLTEDEAGDVDCGLQFEETPWDGSQIRMPAPLRQEAGDCYLVPAGTNGGRNRLRLREAWDEIAAYNGTEDIDSYLDLTATPSGGFNLFSFNNDGGGYTMIDGQNTGALVMIGSRLWEADVDDLEPESKHWFVGGWGLIFPTVDALQDVGDSEPGQTVRLSGDGVLYYFDGTAWAAVGTGTGTTSPFELVGSNWRMLSGVDTVYAEDQDSFLYMGGGEAEVGATGSVLLSSNGGLAGGTGKHLMNGGTGLVVPRLTADPAGGIAGQIYFNTTSNTFRGYDGTAWGELALT